MLLDALDFILLPFYLAIIYFFAKRVQEKRIVYNQVYRHYISGLFVKIFGGIALVLIYTLYYNGGDTTAYFIGGLILKKLSYVNFSGYLEIMGNNLTHETYSYFNSSTAYPQYFFDKQSFAVVRASNLISFLGSNSYMLTTVVLSVITYSGIWRLYLVFSELYPKHQKLLSYTVLFVPSVVFWGSGILKDSFTLMGACWFTYSFYNVFIKRSNLVLNSITLVLGALLILQMKPYIFIALVPGALIWFSLERVKAISNPLVKFFVAPFIVSIVIAIGAIGFSSISSSFGQYSSVDKIVEKAVVTQRDLKMDYNEGNSFDIGEFDGSIGSIFRKAPIATFAGLFFPQLWQVRNPVMLLAAIENSILLVLTIMLLLRAGPTVVFKIIRKEPLLIFGLVFSIFFSFSVGLSTSNFGALARYKIPALPFYASVVSLLYYKYLEHKENPTEELIDD